MKLRSRDLSNTHQQSNSNGSSSNSNSSIGIEKEEEEMPCYIDTVPTEIMERFFRDYLDPIDRLRLEPVSKRWRGILQTPGGGVWNAETKIDFEMLTRGHPGFDKNRITDKHLITLFEHVGEKCKELDLRSFRHENLQRFVPEQIAESLESLSRLEKLNMEGLKLEDFVAHLPSTLREIKTTGGASLSLETLETLARKCPNLEEAPIGSLKFLNVDAIIDLIGKFPRQKRLSLHELSFVSDWKDGALASIGQLKQLEQLELWQCVCLDAESLGAIVDGCPRLHRICLGSYLDEAGLFQLANAEHLTALEVDDQLGGEFTDAVLRAIVDGKGGEQLKKLCVRYAYALTEDTIGHLLDRCKSLVSLELSYCPKIAAERSLELVVAEVQRRYGTMPPEAPLPTGPDDPGLFYFNTTEIVDEAKVQALVRRASPWLRFGEDRRENI